MLKKTLLGLAAMFLTTAAFAVAAPLQINFQGKLLDPATNAPKNGSISFQFSIYDAASGGRTLWGPETQSLTVTNGVFSAQLGSVLALTTETFSGGSAYLGITISPDAEMTPRQQLVASPYAYTATQLAQANDVRINPSVTYSTFTGSGNLQVQYGVSATTGAFSATGSQVYSVTTSSGINVTAGSVNVAQWVVASKFFGDGSNLTNVNANNNFTATGNTVFSLFTSSGVQISGGPLIAPFIVLSTGGITASSGTFTGTGPVNYSLVTSSGHLLNAGTLRISGAGSSLDASGTGISAATATFQATGSSQFSLITSSGIQIQGGTLRIGNGLNGAGGIDATGTGITASTGIFNGSGNTQFSIVTASGIQINGGTLDFNGAGGMDASGTGLTASTGIFNGTGSSLFSIITASGILVNGGTLRIGGGPNGAGGIDATGTGITATTATFLGAGANQFSLITSSGHLLNAGTLSVAGQGGIDAGGTGVFASTFTTKATGNGQYGLYMSTGILMSSGTLRLSGTGAGIDAAGYMVVAATFTGSGVGLTGVTPQISDSSGTANVVLVANTESVVVSTNMALATIQKTVLIQGYVDLLNTTAQAGTCIFRLRVNTAGACAIGSTNITGYQINSPNTLAATTDTFYPIIGQFAPASSANASYCITAKCTRAWTITNYHLSIIAGAP